MFKNLPIPASFLFIFVLFNNFYWKIVDFNGFRTQIVKVDSKHPYHLTTTQGSNLLVICRDQSVRLHWQCASLNVTHLLLLNLVKFPFLADKWTRLQRGYIFPEMGRLKWLIKRNITMPTSLDNKLYLVCFLFF